MGQRVGRRQLRLVDPIRKDTREGLIEGDAAEGIASLKQEDGPELQVHGSGNLIQTLLRHNLVDQYRLWVFPLVVGWVNACPRRAPSPPV